MSMHMQNICDALNESRPVGQRVHYEGSSMLGPVLVVQRFKLDNGLAILMQIDPVAPVVCLQTWMRVGSRFEKQGKTGICHLFEHLMFGETETSAHGAFDRQLEEAGAETNAATFLDWTYYHQNLPKEALALAVRLEAERLTKLVLREPQVASEKEVVANERRQRVDDDIDGAVSELLYKEAFHEHAYGIPTIGWMDDIQSFTPEDCVAFYKTYYSPNNATMVAVGDVDPKELLSLVLENYGAIPSSELPVEDVHPEPPQTAERRQTVEKPTATHKVAIGYKAPALGDFDHAPLVVMNEILFGGRASRIHRALIQRQEIATEVRGWVGTFRDPGLYDIWLTARGEQTGAELCAALDVELDRIRREPVTDIELEKAKARLELSTVQGLESVSGKAETIGFYETVLGEPGALFSKLDQYRRVEKSDLLRVARRYLTPTARTVIEVHPNGESDSDEEEEAA